METARRKATPREALDWSLLHVRLGYNLHRANANMRKRFLDATRRVGLLPSHYATLALLERNAQLTPADIGAALFLLPPNVAALIAPLQERGLIKRSPLPSDRRNTVLTLTPKGKRTRRLMGQRLDALESDMLAGFSAGERRTLSDMLIRLG